MKVATAEQMRRCEALAIAEYGISGLALMENAGRGTVEAMARRFSPLAGKKVLLFTGPGNNGGDGFVIARHLLEQGAQPQVVSLVGLETLRGDAAANRDRLQLLPIPLQICQSTEDLPWVERLVADSDLVVDALLGTGLAREVTGIFAAVIRVINGGRAPVVGVDIPSGLDSDTGLPQGRCVRAQLTCTYGLVKLGQLQPPGKDYVGELAVVDIGIPPEVVARVGIAPDLLDAVTVRPWVPMRRGAAHKGTFGHLLAIAGSEGKAGAAILCALGALRSGVGLATLAVPQALNAILQDGVPEAMTLPLPFSRRCFSDADYDEVLAACKGKRAVAVGPGLGQAEETGRLMLKMYAELPLPMVVDADGLNLLAGTPALLAGVSAPRILTPHPGEMARLAGRATGEIQEDRPAVAAEFARRHGVFIVLKGAATVVAAPDGRLAVNSTGNPGMAAGGMGDVLTGLVAGLLAQGVAPWEACCLAVYVHGRAADRLRQAGMPFGFLASEVAAEIPAAFQDVLASC
ncbi:NAD(P)H-hydrate dehydratase [Thiovibrio sp. JS02]